MKWISLGSTCQPAYWIRNELKQPEAYFFDWLITPPKALVKVLEDGVNDLLLSDNLSIHHKGIRVVDDFYGLEFQHDFPEDEKGLILDGYENHISGVKEKYIRRYERFLKLFQDKSEVCFVRYGDREEAIKFLEPRLKELLGSWNAIFIFASEHIKSEVSEGKVYKFKLPKSSDWKGDEAKWKEIISTVLSAQNL